jgi:hypothetical protein
MISRLLQVACFTVLSLVAGCSGYTHSFALPPGAQGAKTFAFELFKNRTLYTNLEYEFTAALQREISAKTPLTVAPSGQADLLVTGAVEAYTLRVLRESSDDDVTRYAISLTASYMLKRLPFDGRPAKVIREAKEITRTAEYEVRSSTTEAEARERAIRRVARQVVSHMFETW